MEYIEQEAFDRLTALLAKRREPQPQLTLSEKLARLRVINAEIDTIMAQTKEA